MPLGACRHDVGGGLYVCQVTARRPYEWQYNWYNKTNGATRRAKCLASLTCGRWFSSGPPSVAIYNFTEWLLSSPSDLTTHSAQQSDSQDTSQKQLLDQEDPQSPDARQDPAVRAAQQGPLRVAHTEDPLLVNQQLGSELTASIFLHVESRPEPGRNRNAFV
jgi:hypothetical protein